MPHRGRHGTLLLWTWALYTLSCCYRYSEHQICINKRRVLKTTVPSRFRKWLHLMLHTTEELRRWFSLFFAQWQRYIFFFNLEAIKNWILGLLRHSQKTVRQQDHFCISTQSAFSYVDHSGIDNANKSEGRWGRKFCHCTFFLVGKLEALISYHSLLFHPPTRWGPVITGPWRIALHDVISSS